MTRIILLPKAFLYLILLAFSFDLIFNTINLNVFYNVIENILFAVLLTLPIHLLANGKLKSYYLSFSYLCFAFCLYFETCFYFLFKSYLNSSAIYVVLDTNFQESKEFINTYIDGPIIAFTIIFWLCTMALNPKKSKLHLNSKKSKKNLRVYITIVFVSILMFLKLTTLIVFNMPYLVLKSGKEYYVESKMLSQYEKDKKGKFTNISKVPSAYNEVYVIVIGESTTRSHLGLYDYYRNTTPELNNIENDLLLYNDVISPHTYTIASLTKALTLGNYENPKLKYNGSIVQLMNQAGFKTYWISNQKPIGVFDTQVTKIGLGASKSIFQNMKHPDEKTYYDGTLLSHLNETLYEAGDKKVVFLHLLGTHLDYQNRYPSSFNYFSTSPKTKFKSKKAFNTINSYDNAVRYNDYIISQIIKLVKETNAKSSVLFFSDHGEEVYNDLEFSGHSADQVLSRDIYEIPFVLWQSEKFIKERNIPFFKNRKYMTDDLFHSLADLVGVKSTEVDSTRSIFSRHFSNRKRIIRDTVNFDTYFNKFKN